MGEAALTMRGGEYAIHGTNNPGSVGGFVSSGCIRMFNRDIRTLFQMVSVGTPVVVVGANPNGPKEFEWFTPIRWAP